MNNLTALSILSPVFPQATITELSGNPNICGWYLFEVTTPEQTIFQVYITEEGEPLIAGVSNLLETKT